MGRAAIGHVMLVAALSLLAVGVSAEEKDIPGQRPKIALVLSGGGARGVAHVGVLKALDRLRIPYDCIAGTSMGAIVGGAVATGTSVPDTERMLLEADWMHVFSDKSKRRDIPYFRKSEDLRGYFDFTLTLKGMDLLPPRNFAGVQHIGLFFRELTDAAYSADFDELPIPFRAMGTDIVTGNSIVLKEGMVAEAMRASMTVPGVFPPIPYRDHLLVDGGIANNLPVTVGRELCGDVVIAVDVSTPIFKLDELKSAFDLGAQAVNVGMQHNMNESLAALHGKDILIVPDLQGYSPADFSRLSELVRIGEMAVQPHEEKLKAYQLEQAAYDDWKKNIQLRRHHVPWVKQVTMEKTRWVSPGVLQGLLDVYQDQMLDTEVLHQKIDAVYARGDFSRISYDLLPLEDGKTVMHIIPEEKPGRDFLRFGLTLYSDFEGEADFTALASLRRAWLNRLGAEWRTDLEIGRDKALYGEWYQPASLGSELFVAAYANYRSDFRESGFSQQQPLAYELRTMDAGLEIGSVFGRWGEVRAGLLAGRGRTELDSNMPISSDRFGRGGYTLRVTYDQLDDVRFPHTGSYTQLVVFKSDDGLGAATDYARLSLEGRHAFTQGANTLLLMGRAGSSLDSNTPYYESFRLGGLFNLSAMAPGHIDARNQLYARAQYYRRVNELPALVGKGIYAGALLESGWGWDNGYFDVPAPRDLPWSAGAYLAAKTIIGPLYLLGAVGAERESAIYLALGASF